MKPKKPDWHPKPERLKLSPGGIDALRPNQYATLLAQKLHASPGWPYSMRKGDCSFRPRLSDEDRRAVRRWRKRVNRGRCDKPTADHAIKCVLEFSWLRQASEYETAQLIMQKWVAAVAKFTRDSLGNPKQKITSGGLTIDKAVKVHRHDARAQKAGVAVRASIAPSLAKRLSESYNAIVPQDTGVTLGSPANAYLFEQPFPYQAHRPPQADPVH